MGFLTFCSVLLNMVCGYPIGKDCVVCSGLLAFGCVFRFWLLGLVCVVGMGYFCMLLLGVPGKYGSIFNYLWINFQYFLNVCLSR